MSTLQNKIDFAALISVRMANPNGDPSNDNCPRTDYYGYGEFSDVCIKRKIRNRMQDMNEKIFVQSEDRCEDVFKSLSERASAVLKGIKDREKYAQKACATWLDVRTFGQVFAFGKSKDKDSVSVGVRGPVSIHQAISISPVEIQPLHITKSVNGNVDEKRSSDTMGTKYSVRFGLYLLKGAINVQLAEKTGFTEEEAQMVKECLRTLFVNDSSAARPDGSMEVVKLYWWQHNCKDGQYSSAKVHRSLKVTLKDTNRIPSSVDDYAIQIEALPGLEPEVIDGL